MSFVLSKLVWPLLAPGNLLVLLLAAGLLLGAGRQAPATRCAIRARIGRILVRIAAAGLVALIVLPVGAWLIEPLEARFPEIDVPARVDGVVVLGGSVDQWRTAGHRQPLVAESPGRITEMVHLMRRYPQARVVFTGGSGMLTAQDVKEAPVVRDLLDRLGADSARVLFEAQSRNTWENAVLTRDLVRPKPDETWLLVTSAYHMPRSVGVFRRAGWTVVPYPTDFMTIPADLVRPPLNLGEGLKQATIALREWIGLIAYFAMGRLDTPFPGPENAAAVTASSISKHSVN